jgi:putative 4-mercaptohistidine N1-methyltranferase
LSANPYESDRFLNEYLLFHYGTAEEILGDVPAPREALDFAVRSVTSLIDPPESRVPSALDIGCAVGRSTFELTLFADAVAGIDYSHRFIQAAQHLQAHGSMEAEKIIEGDICERFLAAVPPGVIRSRARFAQGDAMSLPEGLGPADIVLAANLICRLPDPAVFLARLPSLVKPGGQLLLTTPFTWLDTYTPRDKWLGGRPGGSSGFDALKARLEDHFTLEHTVDLPFLIREHARKFQYGIALGSRWRRR